MIVSIIYRHLYKKKVVFLVEKKKENLVHKCKYSPDKDNISSRGNLTGYKKIRAWNILFNECQGDPKKIADIINGTWLDPDYKIKFVGKEGDGD